MTSCKAIEGANPRRRLCTALGAAALLQAAAGVPLVRAAAGWPAKPITLLVPFPPGNATDAMIRAIAPALGKALGQSIVVDTRSGAAGTLATALMAQSKQADGYQMAIAPATIFKVPHMQKVPWHPLRDLTYIVGFSSYTFGLVVPGDAPYKTLEEFAAAARQAAQPLSVGMSGAGSSGHAATVLLAKHLGIELQSVPFTGGAQVLQALIGGHIQAMIDGGWMQPVRQNNGRALVTFSAKRLLPDVPTAREKGIDLVTQSPIGLVGPKGMDAAVVQKIQNAVREAMQSEEFRRVLQTYDMGGDYLDSAEYRQLAEQMWVSERQNLEMLGLITPGR